MPATVPPPTPQSLADAQATLKRRFGYADFRRPQKPAIEAVLAGRDALVVLPTGGGKSLCYQVPALMREGLTVVDLAADLAHEGPGRRARTARPAGDLHQQHAGARAQWPIAWRARSGASSSCCTSPPNACDAGRTLERLAGIGVALLAVDEAHCISEWGHDFRPAYRRIGQIRHGLGLPQTVALTATATPDVRRRHRASAAACAIPRIVLGGFDRTNLSYHVIPTRTQADKDKGADRVDREPSRTGHRVRAHAQGRGTGRRRCSPAAQHRGGGVSRRARRDAPPTGAGCLHGRGRARDRGDQRLRHGHRQAGRAARGAPRHARLAGGVLPGGRARRARRQSLGVRPAARVPRPLHARVLRAVGASGTAHDRARVAHAARHRRSRRIHGAHARRDLGATAQGRARAARRAPRCACSRSTGASWWSRQVRSACSCGCWPRRPASGASSRASASSSGKCFAPSGARWARASSPALPSTSTACRRASGPVRALLPVLERLQAEQFIVWQRSGGGYRLAAVGDRGQSPAGGLERARRVGTRWISTGSRPCSSTPRRAVAAAPSCSDTSGTPTCATRAAPAIAVSASVATAMRAPPARVPAPAPGHDHALPTLTGPPCRRRRRRCRRRVAARPRGMQHARSRKRRPDPAERARVHAVVARSRRRWHAARARAVPGRGVAPRCHGDRDPRRPHHVGGA